MVTPKEKINNNTLDASQFPMFDSVDKATAGSIDRSKKIAELRKDDIEKATKKNKVQNEVKRLTSLYGKPTVGQENLNKNPNQSRNSTRSSRS